MAAPVCPVLALLALGSLHIRSQSGFFERDVSCRGTLRPNREGVCGKTESALECARDPNCQAIVSCRGDSEDVFYRGYHYDASGATQQDHSCFLWRKTSVCRNGGANTNRGCNCSKFAYGKQCEEVYNETTLSLKLVSAPGLYVGMSSSGIANVASVPVLLVLKRPGLTRGDNTVSLTSADNTKMFLHHHNYIIKSSGFQESPIFRKDASFLLKTNAWYADTISFESVNFPCHFISSASGRIKIEPFMNSDEYKRNASFYII